MSCLVLSSLNHDDGSKSFEVKYESYRIKKRLEKCSSQCWGARRRLCVRLFGVDVGSGAGFQLLQVALVMDSRLFVFSDRLFHSCVGYLLLLSRSNESDFALASTNTYYLRTLCIFEKSPLSGRKCVYLLGSCVVAWFAWRSYIDRSASSFDGSLCSKRREAIKGEVRRRMDKLRETSTPMALRGGGK